MLRFLVRKDLQPRSSKGHPHQRTAGVARASCTQFQYGAMALSQAASFPAIISAMETATSGSARATLIQKRRLMLRNSSFSSGPVSSVNVRGSSAIPQIGHAPSLSLTTSGSIGQIYSILPLTEPLAAGGGACVTSGCISECESRISACECDGGEESFAPPS